MIDPQAVEALRNVKVPENLKGARAFIDHMVAEMQLDTPSQTPQEAHERTTGILSAMTYALVDVIAAVGDIEQKLLTITGVVNQHTEAVKQIAQRLS